MLAPRIIAKLGLSNEQQEKLLKCGRKASLENILRAYDVVVQNHGIEAMFCRVNNRKTQILYSNTGDPYTQTLLLLKDNRGERLVADDVGRWAEKASRMYTANEFFEL
jgi:hypothetical protein